MLRAIAAPCCVLPQFRAARRRVYRAYRGLATRRTQKKRPLSEPFPMKNVSRETFYDA